MNSIPFLRTRGRAGSLLLPAIVLGALSIGSCRAAPSADLGQGGDPNPCTEADSSLQSLASETHTLVLGEIHGSSQIPPVALQAVCASLTPGDSVVLGLEIWTEEQGGVERFLASKGEPADREMLLEGRFWQLVDDGRSSAAMFELIEGMRRLVGAGLPVTVVCFDDLDPREGETRDDAMGRAFLAHRAARRPSTRYVVLTGNVHARTTDGTPWDPFLQPMAYHLAGADPTLRSLIVRHSGGTFWACAPDCGVQTFGGSGAVTARGVELFPGRDYRGFDGIFDVGPSTASLPAAQP